MFNVTLLLFILAHANTHKQQCHKLGGCGHGFRLKLKSSQVTHPPTHLSVANSMFLTKYGVFRIVSISVWERGHTIIEKGSSTVLGCYVDSCIHHYIPYLVESYVLLYDNISAAHLGISPRTIVSNLGRSIKATITQGMAK